MPTNRIMVTAWKVNNNIYPGGQTVQLQCDNTYYGIFGINMAGEEVAVPTTTIPPLSSSPGTTYQSSVVLLPQGRVWVNTAQFGDPDWHVVVKVKDNTNNNVVYVDLASWNTQIPNCNFLPIPATCPILTEMQANPIGATTATINYVVPSGVVGIEYVNNTTSATPTGDGTYVDGGTTSVSLTGLVTATIYIFHYRTICAKGIRSAWQNFTFTTS